ncbi:hypothetical protein HPPN135_07270 [Helicobacter pylori Puno135]|nr:hypothetical protein HPPN135_05855 [Helicobacter pylori Puno135]AEN19115.1 hypothetical protein HPPN135_07270 [Helicobacter pylori Puno135]
MLSFERLGLFFLFYFLFLFNFLIFSYWLSPLFLLVFACLTFALIYFGFLFV